MEPSRGFICVYTRKYLSEFSFFCGISRFLGLWAILLNDAIAIAANRHGIVAVVAGQSDCVVDATRTEDLSASPAVAFARELIEWGFACTSGGAAQSFPVHGHRVQFAV